MRYVKRKLKCRDGSLYVVGVIGDTDGVNDAIRGKSIVADYIAEGEITNATVVRRADADLYIRVSKDVPVVATNLTRSEYQFCVDRHGIPFEGSRLLELRLKERLYSMPHNGKGALEITNVVRFSNTCCYIVRGSFAELNVVLSNYKAKEYIQGGYIRNAKLISLKRGKKHFLEKGIQFTDGKVAVCDVNAKLPMFPKKSDWAAMKSRGRSSLSALGERFVNME